VRDASSTATNADDKPVLDLQLVASEKNKPALGLKLKDIYALLSTRHEVLKNCAGEQVCVEDLAEVLKEASTASEVDTVRLFQALIARPRLCELAKIMEELCSGLRQLDKAMDELA
jgi:hypothetical protein